MAWETDGPTIFEWEDEHELKLQFARILASNPSFTGQDAGYEVFPGTDNFGRALQAARAWPHDAIVRAEIRRLRNEGVGELLSQPDGKIERIAWDIAECTATDAKDRIAALRLVGELQGKLSKGTNIQVNQDNRKIVNVLRVPMQIRTPEQREEFNRRFKEQQTTLIADARSSRPAAAA